jgi:hypothetical protein
MRRRSPFVGLVYNALREFLDEFRSLNPMRLQRKMKRRITGREHVELRIVRLWRGVCRKAEPLDSASSRSFDLL